MQRTFQLPVELGPLEVTSCEYKTDIHIRQHALKKNALPLTFLVNFRARTETTCETIFFSYYQECNVTKCSYKLMRQQDTTRTYALRKKNIDSTKTRRTLQRRTLLHMRDVGLVSPLKFTAVLMLYMTQRARQCRSRVARFFENANLASNNKYNKVHIRVS